MKLLIGAVTSSVILGCGSSTASRSPQEQACLDAADAVAKVAQRCGADYKASYDEFVQSAADGSCANIVQIRDEAALRHTCIPSLSTISCADFLAAKIDETCSHQLLRPADLKVELAPATNQK